jgi:hypothetical protein
VKRHPQIFNIQFRLGRIREFIVSDTLKPYTMITDFITGREIPNIGAEENRQAVAQYLVNEKGYIKDDIAVDVKIELAIAGKHYLSQVDLVVKVNDGSLPIMAIKCAAGSLGSREREIVAAARLLENHQIPVAVVSDGKTAFVLDTLSGKKTGEGMAAIPSKEAAISMLDSYRPISLPADRLEREKLIFRTYDSENVNVQRKR